MTLTRTKRYDDARRLMKKCKRCKGTGKVNYYTDEFNGLDLVRTLQGKVDCKCRRGK